MRILYPFLLCIFFIVGGCSPWVELQCPPDNKPVLVLKKVDKAFPVYAVAYKANLDASIATIGSLKDVGVTAELETKLEQLRIDLDQESATIENFLKAALIAYQGRPCDDTVSGKYWDTFNLISEQSTKLRELKQDLLRQKSDPTGSPTEVLGVLERFRQDYTFFEDPSEN